MSLIKPWICKGLCRDEDSARLGQARLDAALDGYARHAQDMSDLGFFEARCVVLKG